MAILFRNSLPATSLKGIPFTKYHGTGKYYQPIPHHESYRIVADCVKRSWGEYSTCEVAISRNMMECVSCFVMRNHYLIVFQISTNYHRKSYSYFGYLSDNIPILPYRTELSRLHRSLSLSSWEKQIDITLSRWTEEMYFLPSLIEVLDGYRLSVNQYQDLLLTLARDSILPWSRLEKIDRKYQKSPSTSCLSFVLSSWAGIRYSPCQRIADQLSLIHHYLPVTFQPVFHDERNLTDES